MISPEPITQEEECCSRTFAGPHTKLSLSMNLLNSYNFMGEHYDILYLTNGETEAQEDGTVPRAMSCFRLSSQHLEQCRKKYFLRRKYKHQPSSDFSGPTKLLQLGRNWGTEMFRVLCGVTAGLSPPCFPAEASGPLGLALPLAERDLAWGISEMPRGRRGQGSPWNPS